MKNKNILTIVLIIVVGGGSFFAGTKYQQAKKLAKGNFQGDKVRQQSNSTNKKPAVSSKAIKGEILNKDKESIIVKLPDGSSKIILISENTTINKTTEGSVDDLETGKQIVAFGQENSDKSISATNIQLDFGFRDGD